MDVKLYYCHELKNMSKSLYSVRLSIFIYQTKRKTGYGEEAGRIAFNILNRNSASPFPKKPGKDKDDKKDKDVKKGVGI
jgi:hypothetical protein